MFIPPGSAIHESLATSYVLVNSLVDDLCEGGFSGVVEVVLRDTDSFIIIASGDVAAVVEKRSANPKANGGYTRATIEELAERSRRERGRVSVHGYSAATASAVAGRINAQPLYVGLSTEFTDLEKMISKLVREPDREWFIEVGAEDIPTALIHMRDAECLIVRPTGEANSGAPDLAGNAALVRLVDECNRAGATFDVYFRLPAETACEPVDRVGLEADPEYSATESLRATEESPEAELPSFQPPASTASVATEGFAYSDREAQPLRLADLTTPSMERNEAPDLSAGVAAAAASQPSPFTETATPAPAADLTEPRAGDLSVLLDEFPAPAAGAEAMSEVKRLMGEIAQVIEGAAQAVGRPDSFSMSLRTGQLKIADRFPFLDPFAGDFEYLAGEIVFVGKAPTEEFIAGLTEALKIAIQTVMRATTYAERFRSYVSEDLQKLLSRERADFEKFGLDQTIQQLLAS